MATKGKKVDTTTKKPRKELIREIIGRRPRKKFLSENQKEYYDILNKNEITICTGPAGVGKSYVAMSAAIQLLMDENNSYEKLIIVRPAVEAEEKLGADGVANGAQCDKCSAMAVVRLDNCNCCLECGDSKCG